MISVYNKLKNGFQSLYVHQGFRKYFANTSWLFAEQLLRIVASLLVGVYVARYLGPENFGLFNYVLAFVGLFAAFSKLGLDGIIVRDLVNSPEKRDLYLGTAFWLKILGAIVAGSVIAVGVITTENDFSTKIYIGIIASGLIFQAYEVVDFYLQSRVLSKYVSLCKIFQLLISSLLRLFLVIIGADLFWFVLVTFIDQITLAVALAFAYSRQKIGSFYLGFNIKIAKELLLSARPLIISGIMVSIYSSIDRVIIKEMLGNKEVGLYAAATGLTGALYFVPALISNSLFPAILNARQRSVFSYNQRLSYLYKYIVLFGVLVSLFVSIFSGFIIKVLYGIKFAESAAVLQIYIWNFVLISFSAVFGKWLLSENLQYLLPRFTLMAIVVNILGCFLLIPAWSIKGAAVAALAAQLIPLVWFGIVNKYVKSQLKMVMFLK